LPKEGEKRLRTPAVLRSLFFLPPASFSVYITSILAITEANK
jgi:hypothetical protein